MKGRHLFILALAVTVLGWLSPVSADPVGNLYAANVHVHDQSVETRNAALQDAMAQVLVKVTGSRTVLETAEGRTLLDNAARFLQQYYYDSVRPVPEDPEAPRLVLHMEFDGVALERRLRAAGLPLWGRERPMTLAWIALSADSGRDLLGAYSPHPVVDAFRRAAVRRGLPVTLPALDTEDLTRVSFMDVWGVFEDPLLAAAERYSPDAVVSGSIFKAGEDLWAGRWTLLRDDQRQRWELKGTTPEAVAIAAIDALAEHYANEFAVYAPAGGTGSAILEITDVARLKSYVTVQSYLGALSVVDDVNLKMVDGDTLRFELDLNGTTRALEQAIALGRVLEPLPPPEVVVPLGPQITGAEGTQSGPAPKGETVTPMIRDPLVPLAAEPPVLRYRLRR